MPREVDPSINESDFVHKVLAKGLRTDGRTPYEQRAVKLSFSGELGSVECRLGDTRCVPTSLECFMSDESICSNPALTASPRLDRVLVQVSAEIVKPLADRPYEGFLTISTEISPMASSTYEAGR